MASATKITGAVMYDTLVNYLVSMSRTVEGAMNRALDALVDVDGCTYRRSARRSISVGAAHQRNGNCHR